MKYYMHDTNSFNDEKITELYIKFGYEGLGLFYTLLEKLAYQERPIKTSVLKTQLKVGKKLTKCWNFMEEIELISSKNGETFNENLLKNSENYQIKKEKNKEKISEWREKQKIKNNVTSYEPESNHYKDNIIKDNITHKGEGVGSLPVTNPDPLPENLKLGYVAAQKFILQAKQLPKLQNLSPENYASMRETYSHDQIMEQLAEMENYKKLEKNNANIYLTCLNWLKRTHGKPENTKLVEDIEAIYREFIIKQTGLGPKIDAKERQSLNVLAEWLKDQVTSKSAEGALKCWEWILAEWENMDSFMQARIKLSEIEKDISKIIKAIKDAKANNGNTGQTKKPDTGKRRDIA